VLTNPVQIVSGVTQISVTAATVTVAPESLRDSHFDVDWPIPQERVVTEEPE